MRSKYLLIVTWLIVLMNIFGFRSFLVCVLVATLAGVVMCKPNNGYIVNRSNGIGYRLMYQAQPWGRAKEVCAQEGAKLAKLVRGMSFHEVADSDNKLLNAHGTNKDQMYKSKPGDATSEPHCVGVDALNPGFRDYWCSRHQPYLCQIHI
ncbi:Lectin5 [Operophtera brumata]|uniref:Lectin5 n=1 Tax=Operophtera brumata TaxID=104452 RepID=A0A0L7LIB2_OPEBR|nr:Lectin5 [Operophtera brumata]